MPLFSLDFNFPNKKSKRKDLTFCRVPKIIKNQGEETEILLLKVKPERQPKRNESGL